MQAVEAMPAVLHMVCGKIAAGKSMLTQRLSAEPKTVLISEDAWLARLYPNEIQAIADYVRYAARLRDTLAPHIESLLAAGVSVVLDFPANTVANRLWGKSIYEKAGADHILHYLDISDGVCKQRLRDRNAAGLHPFNPSNEEFEAITRHFVPPAPEEGFRVVRYD